MSTQTAREVVGIVGDVRHRSVAEEAVPNVYAPYLQYPRSLGVTFVLRTAMSPAAATPSVRAAISRVDSTLPLFDVRALGDVLDGSVAKPRFETGLLSFFAFSALVLAAVGLYGLVSYSVRRRIPEIGLRVALGADAADVRNLVLGEGARLALLGVGLGIAGSLALTRFLTTLLYGVSPSDGATFLLAAVGLLAVALASSYLPARRAMRIDPIVALRYE